jgi:hypothetical protein
MVYILSSLSTLTHVCVACQKTFVKRRSLFLGIMAMSCFFFVFFFEVRIYILRVSLVVGISIITCTYHRTRPQLFSLLVALI